MVKWKKELKNAKRTEKENHMHHEISRRSFFFNY